MKTHNTPKSVAEEITILEQVLDQINDTPSVSKELLNALAEALFDALQSDINPPQAIDVVIQAFDYLMCNDEYYLFQRKLLSIHSRGDKKVLSKAATTFGLRLNALVLAKQPPDKGLLIQLLILRNYIGKFWVDCITHDPDMLTYIINKQGSKKITLGSDYPFPLGDLEIGKFIEEMNLKDDTVEDIFCNSTLEWLKLNKEDFI